MMKACHFAVLAAAAPAALAQSETLCRAAPTDSWPASLGKIKGVADNDCCHYYVASSPATITDLPIDQGSGKITKGSVNTKVIPADLSSSLGADAELGALGEYALQLYAPVANGTHGAVMIVSTDRRLQAQKVSPIVSEPLAFSSVDYGSELVYAGSKDAKELFVFKSDDLQAQGTVKLQSALKDVAGSALKAPGLLYIASSNGAMQVVNITSGAVTNIGGIDLASGASVFGLANIWGYLNHGSFHFATSNGLEHYDDCSSQKKAGSIVV